MKITIITVAYNAEEFIEKCIHSVLAQTHFDTEYILVDGKSQDNTVAIAKRYENPGFKIVSEKDKGIYDAMNKGIALATGDIIGILNADDFFAHENVLAGINKAFTDNDAEVVYGDLWYVDRYNTGKTIRKWKSQNYRFGMFQWGWMPAHPTFYAKKELFEKYGNYNLEFGSAGDYELMLRFLHKRSAKAVYLPEVIVKMRTGGVSNSSWANRIKASMKDLSAMRYNSLNFPELAVVLKPLRKIPQFF